MCHINFTRSVWLDEKLKEIRKLHQIRHVSTPRRNDLFHLNVIFKIRPWKKFYKYKAISSISRKECTYTFLYSQIGREFSKSLKLWNSKAFKHPTSQIPKNPEGSRKFSSFFVKSTHKCSQDRLSRPSPKGPWRSIHRSSKINPQRPLKIRSSSFIKIKPKGPWRYVHHRSSRSSPEGPLEDSFILIHQDQAPKALEDPFIVPNDPLDQQYQQIYTTVHPYTKPRRPFGSTTLPQIYTLRR